MCPELPLDHKLQRALDRMGSAYHMFCCQSGSQEKAKQSRAIWNGVCLWLARQLGPIPSALLDTDVFDGLLRVLENRHQPLDKTCAYFKLSMVCTPTDAASFRGRGSETAQNTFPTWLQRWLINDLEGPLVLYVRKVDEFYKALHAEHSWLVRSLVSRGSCPQSGPQA